MIMYMSHYSSPLQYAATWLCIMNLVFPRVCLDLATATPASICGQIPQSPSPKVPFGKNCSTCVFYPLWHMFRSKEDCALHLDHMALALRARKYVPCEVTAPLRLTWSQDLSVSHFSNSLATALPLAAAQASAFSATWYGTWDFGHQPETPRTVGPSNCPLAPPMPCSMPWAIDHRPWALRTSRA